MTNTQTTRKLKVFGICYGTNRRICAAMTKTQAARRLDVSIYEMNKYGSETGNVIECALCLANPDMVFQKLNGKYNNDWVNINVRS